MDSDELASTRPGRRLTVEPWRELPAQVADLLEPELPTLSADILATIAREVPEYRRPLEGSFGRGLRVGVVEALRQFVALIRDPDAGRGPGREVYVGLGQGELRQGRSLDSLQSAYRIGARVAWRHAVEAGRRAGLEPEVLYLLGEAIFAYIDELSAESVEGYTAEQATREGVLEVRRRRLLTLLADEPPIPLDELSEAANDAGLALPDRLAALVCEAERQPRIAGRLPTDCLSGILDGFGCIAIPDPQGPGRRDLVERAVGTERAALGPALGPAELARSWREARAALAGSEHEGLLVVDEHLMALVLAEGHERIERLGARRLGPLDELTPAARRRMLDTLAAFLRRQGSVTEIAADLHLHPQTVRYRIRRLRELLGDQIDDPDARFELDAVLRAGGARSVGLARVDVPGALDLDQR